MKKAILLILMALSGATFALGQGAEVTFYSYGSAWTTGLPGAKHGIFIGYIFDGPERIATLRKGRFVTFRLAPGPHVFSASHSGNHPADNSHFAVTLLEGETYFVRAQDESRGVVVIESQKGRLDQVTCQTAHNEAEGNHALEERNVSLDSRTKMIATISIPSCK